MDRFKLKKIKGTKFEKLCISILLLITIASVAIYPLEGPDTNIKFQTHDADEIINSLSFAGVVQSKMVFSDTYANVVCNNDGKIESHFVNLIDQKVVNLNDFIKDEFEPAFYEKERELLLLKYPRKIVDILVQNTVKTHMFNSGYLMITYDTTGIIETARRFNLKIDYHEIKDYLEFVPVIENDPFRESGFEYDVGKTSVAFTFDDGPNGKKTQKLIDVLEDYKMSATFFMVANKLNNDSITVKKVYGSHSEVGYHSFHHEYFTRQSQKEIQTEFAKADETLFQITGGHFKLTRPPYGAYNKNTLQSIDNAFIRWNLDTNDWRYRDVEYIKKYVLDNLSDNSIILFHDTYDTSIEAATSLMEILYLMDVQVLSVSELAKLKGVTLENHEVYYDFK